ncbi:MGMT family protein [Corynebacterium sp. H128]|uniref:MGMT family protein n=1 Tax=unclassified Corynebacterium TaxID=2624378 RepID=UPI00309941D0
MTPLAEAVVDYVSAIPRGQVATYGEVGAAVGCGPRQVGRIMRDYGGITCWWRVVRADGTSAVADSARPHWIADGLPLTETGVDLRTLGQ